MKRWLKFVAVAGAFAVVSACGDDSGSEPATSVGTTAANSAGGSTTTAALQVDRNAILKFGGYTAQVLDPIRASFACEPAPLNAIFDTLLAIDTKSEIQPRLAESYELAGNVLRLKLRTGVKFQDGTPFDADAVKFNLDRAVNDPATTIKASLSAVSAVTVVNPTTVELTLSAPVAGNLLRSLADRAGMMASPTAVRAAGSSENFSKAPVGAGMYKVDGAWTPRQKITLRSWPDYWDKSAQTLGGIDMIEVAGEAQLNAIRAGDIDMTILDNIGATTSLGSNYKVVVQDANQYGILVLNESLAPLDNLKVRQAISQAIDRQAIATAVTSGKSKAAYQVFPSTSPAYDASLDALYPYNVAKAKQLLTEAGFPNGFDLKAGVGNASPLYLQIGELIAGQLKQVGINMTITPVDQAQAFNMLIRGTTYQAAPFGGQALPDTAQQFRDYFLKGGINNAGNNEAPGIADLVTKAGESIDAAVRGPLFKQANKIAVEQVQHGVVLYFQPSVQVERKYVGGVQPGLLACNFNFRGVFISPGKVDVS